MDDKEVKVMIRDFMKNPEIKDRVHFYSVKSHISFPPEQDFDKLNFINHFKERMACELVIRLLNDGFIKCDVECAGYDSIYTMTVSFLDLLPNVIEGDS